MRRAAAGNRATEGCGMPEFFLELFSEEIPARMQARAAEDLARLTAEALAPLSPSDLQTLLRAAPHRPGGRRWPPRSPPASTAERGPRANAPAAGAGRLPAQARRHPRATSPGRRLLGAGQGGGRGVGGGADRRRRARRCCAASPGRSRCAGAAPARFTWVRPLRRITCLLDGAVVPFDLREGDDDGHGLAAVRPDRGPPLPRPRRLRGARLRRLGGQAARPPRAGRCRRSASASSPTASAASPPPASSPWWTIPACSTRSPAWWNGRSPCSGASPPSTWTCRPRSCRSRCGSTSATSRCAPPDGRAAPWFAFVANVEAADGGAAIVAGNERVLRARFADARHFWDLDRKARLESRVPPLEHVTFHAKLGSQGDRVRRLRRLARAHRAAWSTPAPALAERAAELAKADLVTGMVGEFPELQGVMGRYYALHDGEDRLVADAIRDHYAPKGPSDAVPTEPVSIAVALADKLDQLAGFFAIGEKPTGAGDPYALRRAALGVIRIVRENRLRLHLLPLIEAAGQALHRHGVHPVPPQEILDVPRRAPARPVARRGRPPRRAGRGVRRRRRAWPGRRPDAPAGARRRGGRAAGHRAGRAPICSPPTAAPPISCASRSARTARTAAPPDPSLLRNRPRLI